jgi:alpha/beta superfamily hydrolase
VTPGLVAKRIALHFTEKLTLLSNTTLIEGEPFYFGPPDQALFGCYHAPQPALARPCGLVLCNPMGHEYIRAHRALRQLAVRLAKAGFHVLRFDYYGSGDSSGDDEQGSLAQWRVDIETAIQELRRRSRVRRIYLAGLRLGASLAALIGEAREDLAGLVLWEPVINGESYIEELAGQHQALLWRFANQPKDRPVGSRPTELLGFPLTDTLSAELLALDLLSVQTPRSGKVLLIEREPSPDAKRLHDHLASLSAQMQHQQIPGPKVWTEDPDKGLVPHQTLQAIVAWLAEVCA